MLVTGATGAVGPSVVAALNERGCRVRVLSLNGSPDGLFPAAVDDRRGDVAESSVVESVMQDIDVVIHMAALLHVMNPTTALREKYERINVGGTANVINSAVRAGVKRVVFVSTIAVYGDSCGEILTEDAVPRPQTFYAQTKLSAERLVLNAKTADGRALGTVLRLGAVYGARVKGNYRRLLRSLARDRFIPIGDGMNRRTLIHDRDVGKAVGLVMDTPEAAGDVYNVSDGQIHTLNEIIGTMCTLLGRRLPRISLPTGPVRFVAGCMEDVARLVGGRPFISRSAIDKYTEDMAVDSHRIQSALGFAPDFDLRAGWKLTIEEMRKNGEL